MKIKSCTKTPLTLPAVSRRRFLQAAGAGLFVTGINAVLPLPAWARSAARGLSDYPADNRYDLTIDYSPIIIDGREGTSTGINGTVPGPLVRLREGERVRLNVTNRLMDTAHASFNGKNRFEDLRS